MSSDNGQKLGLVVDDTKACFDYIRKEVGTYIPRLMHVRSAGEARTIIRQTPGFSVAFVDLSLVPDTLDQPVRANSRTDSGVLLIKQLMSGELTNGSPIGVVAITGHEDPALLSTVQTRTKPHSFWHKLDEDDLRDATRHAIEAANGRPGAYVTKTIKRILAPYQAMIDEIKNDRRLKLILDCVADNITKASEVKIKIDPDLEVGKRREKRTILSDMSKLFAMSNRVLKRLGKDDTITCPTDLARWAKHCGFGTTQFHE